MTGDTMNHIFYQTKTKYNNTGDALINKALIEALRTYGQIYANYGDDIPKAFLGELGIRDEERVYCKSEVAFIKSVLGCARKAKKCGDKVFVFSGPGDMYGGGLRLVVRNFASGLVFPVFRMFGVNIVRIGRSVGPISKAMAVSEWVRGLFLSHYYVRDSLSLKRCHDIGIKKTKLCPDMSWAFDSKHQRKVNQTNRVMVNLRNSIFDDTDDTFIQATVQRCKDVLRVIQKETAGNMKVCVAYQISEDAEFSKQVAEILKNDFDVEYIDHQMRLEELAEHYGNVDCHISNRMHSLLAGYKYGSLPISLIDTKHHVKIAGTLQDCKLEDLMVDIYAPLDEQALTELVKNRTAVMDRLWKCEQEKVEQIHTILKHVCK